MGFLDRIFGKKRAPNAGAAADLARSQKLTDRARSQQMAGRETGQTADEQAATRGRMEAELTSQRERREGAPVPPPEVPVCPHTTLVPRWDSVADMGHEEKATGYTCQGCDQSFTAAEGHALQETEAERLRQKLDT